MHHPIFGSVRTVMLLALVCLSGGNADVAASHIHGRVKHIILFIGDGMQLEHEIAASRYLFGKDDGLSFHKLAYAGHVATWDVTTYNQYAAEQGRPAYAAGSFDPLVGYDPARGGQSPFSFQPSGFEEGYFFPGGGAKPRATDSASATTALATGVKTDAGNLSWQPGDPAGGSLKTIAEMLREEKGAAVGVVSTVPFSHATPAAMVSHNVSRNNYAEIASEIIRNTQPEVVIGGGYPGAGGTGKFNFLKEDDYRFLKAGAGSNPYVFVERSAGEDGSMTLLEGAERAVRQGRKLFGLYGGPGGNFESPLPGDLPDTPHVQRTTRENPLLADATLAALKVLSRDPDGFFVMIEQGDIDWANHANDYRRMVGTVWDLHQAVQAAIDFVDRPDDSVDWSNTLLLITSDHANSRPRFNAVLRAGDLPRQEGACSAGGPACTYPDADVGYGTTRHTNELVMLYAHGALQAFELKKYEGEWYPCTRIIDNSRVFHLMAEAAGLPRRSPLEPVIDRLQPCGRR